jgi:4-methylaminobutanoate oxidase (formaldehyde-forming)
MSGEAILHDGQVVGTTTSGGYGHSLGRAVAFGYLPVALADQEDFEIEAFLTRWPAKRGPRCLYDPKGLRLKS